MPSAAKSFVAPLYLLACLILGGSAQGVWQNAVLQLAGVTLIAWAAIARGNEPMAKPVRLLTYLFIAALVVIILQQVPLPSSWLASNARARIAEGFSVLGRSVPRLPISVTPYESLATMLCLIPPVAMFLVIVRVKAFRRSWLTAALLAGTITGIMLGAVQAASASQSTRWYLYPQTNVGLGVGFFANANHMATILVISLPFIGALAAVGRRRGTQRYSALVMVLAAAVLLIAVGIALNGSIAGYVLALPVLASSALIVLGPTSALRRFASIVATLSIVAAIAALAITSVGGGKIGRDATSAVQSREVILATTGRAIADYMPLGSGLGSFVRVYRLYESPDAVTSEYVIHAHNDYVELALELGIPGVLLIAAFLAWWIAAVWAVWRNDQGGPFARAASIASGAILVHSLVDFPLRTAAISTCFAMCLALMADRRQPPARVPTDLRPTRHLVFK